jgi:mTERF domain-containing protein, mitochondrial
LSKSPIANTLGDINEILEAAPELNNYPIEQWQSTYHHLVNEGFASRKFRFIILQTPKLLITPKEKITTLINSWRGYQFGDKETISLLERYPELLNIQHNNELSLKIGTIKEYVGGVSQLVKLLSNSPAVLSDSLPVINEKIDFLKDVMKVTPAEVYKSEALSCDLIVLKTRYEFLQRLGLFVPNKKKDDVANSKNPPLYKITDTSNRKFAAKICHVTLEEYEVFEEVFQRELDNEIEEESSDDENYVHLEDHEKIEIGMEKL